jgi:Succinate dehydrogenase/Fumarate reductase transmembrane subunit.
MSTIEAPRTPVRRRTNWEKWGWLYMRFSGVLLVVLIFGHLLVTCS